jgi:hypothetical protein
MLLGVQALLVRVSAVDIRLDIFSAIRLSSSLALLMSMGINVNTIDKKPL